jgi:hypothetical protein
MEQNSMPVSLALLSIVATALPLLVLSVGMVVLALVALPLPTARRRYVLQSLDRLTTFAGHLTSRTGLATESR